MRDKKRIGIWEIFRVFLYIGATGFGGGMAIVSLTERVCVHDKRWLEHDEFMHGLAFGQILGPFSLNIATFVGYYLRGTAGGIAAAVGFIFPSFCLVSILSWFYFKYHQLPKLQSAMDGTNPVIIALILVAAIGMGKSKVKGRQAWTMALVSFAAAGFFNIGALSVLLAALVWAAGRAYLKREHA